MDRILVVDDEPAICTVLSRFLTSRGFEVETAASGEEALALVQPGRFSMVLCDVSMPGMSGIETVRKLMFLDPDLAVVMVSGVNDARTAVQATSHGAMDYLVKPVVLRDLEIGVNRTLHRRQLLIEQRRVERLLREEVAEQNEALKRDHASLREMTINIVEALISAMEAKDAHLRGHSQRVAAMAAAVAEHLNLDSETVEQVRLAARLHDVGSIGVREAVLAKAGALTPDEMAHVRDHVRIGVEILGPLTHLGTTLRFVEDHHEHWDGGGYPAGRRGNAISIGGRILAACDTYEALTSTRAYQRQMSAADAIVHMRELSGSVLDPTVFAALEEVVEERRTLVFLEDGPAPATS